MPCCAQRARITLNSRSRVATSSVEVASSRIRIRGSRTSARARQTAWRSLSGRLPGGGAQCAGRRSARPSASRPRRRRCSSVNRRRRRPSLPSQMFVSTGCCGTTRISWKTVAIPHRLRMRGESEVAAAAARELDRRRESGRCTPDRIFTSVLLPEAFSPMIESTSPRRSSSEQSRSAWVGPKALARCSYPEENLIAPRPVDLLVDRGGEASWFSHAVSGMRFDGSSG